MDAPIRTPTIKTRPHISWDLLRVTALVSGLAVFPPILSGLSSQTTGPAHGAVVAPPDSSRLPSLDNVRVVSVAIPEEDQHPGHPPEAGLGDVIVVGVRDLKSLVDYGNCQNLAGKPFLPCDSQHVALFLEQREIRGLTPEFVSPRSDTGRIQFHFRRTNETDELWADLLGAPRVGDTTFFLRPTEISIGLSGHAALPSAVAHFRFVRLHRGPFWVSAIVTAVLLALLIWLARKSDLLRDVGPAPDAVAGKAGRKPYSLGRTQMAFWFVLVMCSFVFIWVVTGSMDTITASTLTLIGIGAGTALGGAAIDQGKEQSAQGDRTALSAESVTLVEQIAALKLRADATPVPDDSAQIAADRAVRQVRLAEVSRRLAELSRDTAMPASRHFLTDILSDGKNGISFHRFQMFAWTWVLGVLFLNQVCNRLSMPDFSPTLLALMGISSGTYLGFKIPER